MLAQRKRKRVPASWRASVLTICGLGFAGCAAAQLANTQPPLEHVQIDTGDLSAVRTGAMIFMNQCLGCHSVQGERFAGLAKLTGLSEKEVARYLKISNRSLLDTIVSPMPEALAKSYFGVAPPDLTYEIHLRGADWLYTYLRSFYADPGRPTGSNNVVFYNVAMPNVFAGMQGLQAPVEEEGFREGQRMPIAMGVKPLTRGSMSPQQFDATAKDLVTFIKYLGEPHEPERHALGRWVLVITALWTILMYAVYRLYWRDVVRPHGPRWWSYWKR